MSQNSYDVRIVAALLKAETHIRGLAAALHTNQTTIARKVFELHKNNVVDFKYEGKNKVVFLKKSLEAKQYAYRVETQRLLDLVKKYPSLRRVIELIQKNAKIHLAVLFGSYAKGIAHRESDIDIYIGTLNMGLKKEIETLDTKLSVKIGRYNQESLLIKEIEKNHVIIKGAETYYEKNKVFD